MEFRCASLSVQPVPANFKVTRERMSLWHTEIQREENEAVRVDEERFCRLASDFAFRSLYSIWTTIATRLRSQPNLFFEFEF